MTTKGEDIWQLNVPTTTRVTLRAAPLVVGGTLDTVLNVRNACNDTTDLACNDDEAGTVRSSRIDRVFAPGTYFVIVQEFDGITLPAVGGDYTLTAVAVAQAPNASCATPTALTPGSPITGQNSAAGGAESTACALSAGGQLFYTVTVPARNRLSLTVTPTGSAPVSHAVRLLSSCSATSCDANASGSTPTTLTNDNLDLSPKTVIVSVSPNSPTVMGTFDIVANVAPLPANGACAGAMPLTVGAPALTGQSLSHGGPPSSACLGGQSGPSLYYSVTVPAQQTVTVVATPVDVDFNLRVISTCAATSCVAQSDQRSTVGGQEFVSLTNAGTSPVTYIVNVGSPSGTTAGSFSIFAMNELAGETCAAPTPITSSGVISGQTTVDSVNNIETASCTGTTNPGPDRVYSVIVPGGYTLTVEVQSSSWDSSLYLVRGPASNCQATGTQCLVGRDTLNSGPEVLTWANEGTDSLVYVVVDAWRGDVSGPFALNVVLNPSPPSAYVRTTIAPSCVNVALAPVLPLYSTGSTVNVDDGNSASTVLPFAFNYFGAPVTHFTVNANGFAQLWPTSTPTLSTGLAVYDNTPLPTAAAPNSVLAVFWDDLKGFTTTGTVRTLTAGVAPNRRHVIEWYDLAPYSAGTTPPGEVMRFQVQLVETTNQIEFHYCQLDLNTGTRAARLAGAEATVGIEDALGTSASQQSYNQFNSISVGNAFRFTP